MSYTYAELNISTVSLNNQTVHIDGSSYPSILIKIESVEKRLNMLFGVVIALIAIVGTPQIIVAWRSSKYNV